MVKLRRRSMFIESATLAFSAKQRDRLSFALGTKSVNAMFGRANLAAKQLRPASMLARRNLIAA
jgi:hypothetical protein